MIQTQNTLKKNILLRNLIDLFYRSQDNKFAIKYSSIAPHWVESLYYKNSLNLLFSADQFLYEFFVKIPQRKKISEYKIQIKEQKKLSLFYGYLSRKQLKKYFLESNQLNGEFSKNLITLLERRLDIILYRSQFVKTITGARQLITHKKIRVNNSIVSVPSYRVNPGDIISIDINHQQNVIQNRLSFLKSSLKNSKKSIPFQENTLSNLDLNNLKYSSYSKKHIKTFIKFLIKKTQFRGSILSYKNPFTVNHSKYKYFNIYNELKNIKTNFLNDKFLIHCYRKFVKNNFQHLSKNITLNNILKCNLEKYLFQIFSTDNDRIHHISLIGVKPLHLEISYKLLECIYLYSPQRIYYPFLINFDILQRAYLK